MKRNKAFTLIELVSVLVILAILALIVTPLVLNIIRKARTAADKRSIDAYGRSIELAIADYLLENGTFPTSIEELTIEYSGDRVICPNSGINKDGTIYLTDCTVNGRVVTGYTYGRYVAAAEYKEYTVGQEVRYNNVDYYVIKDSDATESSVTLLKEEPLTAEEITLYSDGTGANANGYGGIEYGISSDYTVSYVKIVVDSWKNYKAPLASEARLITFEEIKNNLGYELTDNGSTQLWSAGLSTPNWIYNSSYAYWTMTPANDSSSIVFVVKESSELYSYMTSAWHNFIRPVIVLSKSVLN